MLKKLFMTVAIVASCIQVNAQTKAAPDYKGAGNNNPISANIFCADPTALEYDGRLYVYGSNDHQQFIANGKQGENTYGSIKSIVVFSTDDMVNWTFHGTIDVAKLCSSWTNNPWYHGFSASWAPSVTWRTAADGTDEFFLYYCSSSHGIGVLKANSPVGPWTSPLKELMIHRDTPGATPCSAVFDPGVVIDENGVGWITFGGLDPVDGGTSIQPKNARIAKLTPDMTALDGLPVRIPAPYHFEANELNVMNGKYVYTYCSNWAQRNDADWNAYKQEHGINVAKPNTCTMCYMVSDDPMNPDSWVYKGVYGPHPGMGTNNNHSHLQKFLGNYYYLYHGASLMVNWRADNIIDQNCGVFRSICVNKATVNENIQNVSAVTPDLTGVSAIKYLNPYEFQQAETMASCGGIEYEDFTNIKTNTRINKLGNDASENMQVRMVEGSWVNQRHIDFGTNGAAKLTLRAKGTGTMEIRSSRPARPWATIELSSTEMQDYTVDVDASKFQGVKNNLFFVITAGTDIYVDGWQFTEVGADAIQELNGGAQGKRQCFDVSGRKLSDAHQRRGIVIEQYTDENGVRHSRKILDN